MQMFITTILTNNFYQLIMYVILILKNKPNIINMTLLQNDCFDK